MMRVIGSSCERLVPPVWCCYADRLTGPPFIPQIEFKADAGLEPPDIASVRKAYQLRYSAESF